MSRFLDGPAAGAELSLRRAPTLLRVVVAPDGTVDALDQLDDDPADDEAVHVYRVVPGTHVAAMVDYRPDRGRSGRYEFADYRHLPDAPGGELRDREAWRAWARRQPKEEEPCTRT